jgi:predicted neuraminidase
MQSGSQAGRRGGLKFPKVGWGLAAAALLATISGMAQTNTQPGVLSSEFIFAREDVSFPQCHASTIAETRGRLAAAWFGGTEERNPDVGIWVSLLDNNHWTKPVEVAVGHLADGSRCACWNPVLFQPKNGPLLLFYKVGPSPSKWWGMLMTSLDGGLSWSTARRLPEGILGPIKDKPVQLSNGDLLCPSSTEDHGWRVHFERTSDLGATWQSTGPVNDGKEFSAIQPTILFHSHGRLQAIGRTRQGRIFQVWSEDAGKTWGKMTATSLPNPNSGIDAVTLRDGRQLVVYNHTTHGRSPLNVSISADGETWEAGVVLERDPGEYSYPAVIQAGDGLVHITYTYKRVRLKHVTVDPAKLKPRAITRGEWPEN